MIYPRLDTSKAATAQTITFAGLNRRETGGDGEFSDMKNMTGTQTPCLQPRRARAEKGSFRVGVMGSIQAMIAPKYENKTLEKFTGVAGGAFYYEGRKIDFESNDMTLKGDICLTDFNGTIIIAPQMYCFSYVPDAETGKIDENVRKMSQGFYGVSVRVSSEGNPEEDAFLTNCLIAQDKTQWKTHFSEGDSIFITGFPNALADNNTVSIDSKFKTADDKRPLSVVVQKIDGDKLYVQMTNRKGKLMVFRDSDGNNLSGVSATLDVYIPIPEMNWVCVHNNRLWGTNPNGEQIYASKLGDPFNFNTFFGLSTDSWYSEIGTRGDFIGLVSFRDSIVAFKRDFIHHVYGDKPTNFTIPKQMEDTGCIDIHSAVQVGGTLYFLGYRGFYAYTGGQLSLVSEKLNMTYRGAAAMTDGKNYYVHAVRDDGGAEFLKYDTALSAWYPEDDIALVGFVRWHNRLYAAEPDKVILMDAGEEEAFEWYAETTVIHENIMETKGVYDIFLRLDTEKGSEVRVFIVRDNGEKRLCGEIAGGAFRTHRMPVRFQMGDSCKIRIEGTGKCTVHGIERTVYAGGKRYR